VGVGVSGLAGTIQGASWVKRLRTLVSFAQAAVVRHGNFSDETLADVGQTVDNDRDMTDVLAYQIGAVFLLAVLFMVGTMTRGLFSADLFKNIKLTVFVVVALLVGFLAYRNRADISSIFNFDSQAQVKAPAPAPAPQSKAPAGTAARSSAPRPAVRIGEVRIIQPADPEPDIPVQTAEAPKPAVVGPPPSPLPQPHPVVSPPAVIAETSAPAAPESGNRAKRAIRSVGRFLHLGHEQYHPGQSVPQNASTP
jgi:hypothetical protein